MQFLRTYIDKSLFFFSKIFQVEDWCFPSPTTQPKTKSETKGKLVLISGLNFSSDSNKLPIILLSDWLSGLIGNVADQESDALVVQVVIAGI